MGDLVRLSGSYITRSGEDAKVEYITFDGKLTESFKQLDLLLNKVFLQSQLPTWLFGSSITSASQGGGGTSHTDASSIKIRYAPVSALLDRLNTNLTKCLGDALYYAQVLENFVHKRDKTEGFVPYTPCYPNIRLSNGIPSNDKENTEIAVLRYQAGLIDRKTAIKILDGINDELASEMIRAIEAGEKETQKQEKPNETGENI